MPEVGVSEYQVEKIIHWPSGSNSSLAYSIYSIYLCLGPKSGGNTLLWPRKTFFGAEARLRPFCSSRLRFI